MHNVVTQNSAIARFAASCNFSTLVLGNEHLSVEEWWEMALPEGMGVLQPTVNDVESGL